MPFAHQRFDLLPVRHAVLRLEYAEFTCLPSNDLADSDADLLGAVVEAEQQSRRTHAWPTWVPSRRRSTPSDAAAAFRRWRSEEHTSELQSLMRISYAVFCLKKKKPTTTQHTHKLINTAHHHE